MKKQIITAGLILMSVTLLVSCGEQPASKSTDEKVASPKLKEETVSYSADTVKMQGFVVYDESTDKKRPAVLVATIVLH